VTYQINWEIQAIDLTAGVLSDDPDGVAALWDRVSQLAEHRLRSEALGTSPSAISLAEHRVEFGVGPDLPDLLRAAAGDSDLGSPAQRLIA
jgi:hypothetical protein